jgi:hypothetical protein
LLRLGLVLILASVVGSAQPAPDLRLYQQTLTRFVLDDGRVKYAELRAGIEPLDRFVQQIGQVSPDSHPALFTDRRASLAYWLNAYNALTLWAMAKDYPEKRKRLSTLIGRGKFFHRDQFLVGGKRRTLSGIEDRSLREKFKDPRIHFAIVCASNGCPWLSQTAFTAENLDAELDKAARLFFSQTRNLSLDPAKRTVRLSSIFDWFAKDFGQSGAQRLAFVARYAPASAQALRSGKWTIEYVPWDWSLNDAEPPVRP